MSSDIVNEHFNNLQELLKIEHEEDLRQYQLKIANRTIQERKKEGVSWYPMSVIDQKTSVGDRYEITVEKNNEATTQKHFFQAGASVSLFSNHSEESYRVSGVVSYLREHKMRIIINSEEIPDWLSQGKVGVDLLFDESSYKEMGYCLKTLQKTDKGRVGEMKALFVGDNQPAFRKTFGYTIPSLNSSQNEALNHVLATKDIGGIHGPPGTGKTTTLVKSIKAVVAEEKQTLVCAPSNVAVDILVEKLVSEGVSVIRLGHPARVTSEVQDSTIDAKMTAHRDYKTLRALRKQSEEYWKMGAKYKRNFGPAERAQRNQIYAEAKRIKSEARELETYIVQQLINDAEVIACTLIGANHRLIRNRFFKTVFIDEAGQALEPACWIPIIKSERVIMAGDHHQLPPTVKSNEAAKRGLSTTLFERMMAKDVGELLREQYRMQPEIMAFSNHHFYGAGLIAAETILQRLSLFEGEEVEFIDTAGCGFQEKINEQTLSTYNIEEAKLLLQHLSGVLTQTDDQLDVGLIAPYKAQVDVLKNELPNWDLGVFSEDQISIHSVDGFQGQEKDIIYISLVRSNDKGEIGFLKDIRRMNVAMTRARFKLVIIGDSATLGTFSFYNELIEFFQEKNWYRSAFEIIYSE